MAQEYGHIAEPQTLQTTSSEGTVLVEALLIRCQNLLDELEAFRDFLRDAKQRQSAEHAVDIKQFHGRVATEMVSLQKLATADPNAEKTIHILKSSNLPFYEAIWEAAKASRALVAFHKRFYWGNRPTRNTKQAAAAQKRCALLDVVAEDGDEWIKVSTVSEQCLLFELAKARWELADSSSEGSDDEDAAECQSNQDYHAEEDELGRIELVRTAFDLRRASQAHRVHYKHPRVRFVLPRIRDPPPADLAPLLERVRSTGAIIDLSVSHCASQSIDYIKKTIFPRLLPSPHPLLTSTLNIDCTILLALASDLSYTANHPIYHSYNGAIRRQIELEVQEHLLPSRLWPAMADKNLVCTTEAVERMREIVDTIGMPMEKARTELILDGRSQQYANEYSNHQSRTAEELRRDLQSYSDYPVPEGFRLPIRIVAAPTSSQISAAVQAGKLPAVAETIADVLTHINRSVFMYGWVHGCTTVSSNRTVTKAIETMIEKDGKGEKGPEIWLSEPARSLLGKEKERRK
ncbi:MAG: hypothetical protein Q9163_005921 [Psora crenata]